MVGKSESKSGGRGVEQAGHLQEPVRPLFGLLSQSSNGPVYPHCPTRGEFTAGRNMS